MEEEVPFIQIARPYKILNDAIAMTLLVVTPSLPTSYQQISDTFCGGPSGYCSRYTKDNNGQ